MLVHFADYGMGFLVRGHKGFKFRIYPNEKQQERLFAWESALRFLWNLALKQRKLGLARVNRSALPVEGTPPEGTRRSRKVAKLRVPRRSPQSPAL